MRDALPILYRLVVRNLDATGFEARAFDPDDLAQALQQVERHLHWVFMIVGYMGATGEYACTVRTAPAQAMPSSQHPFLSPHVSIPLLPTLDEEATRQLFAANFARSLRQLSPEVDLSERARAASNSWIARWIAAAALSSYIAIHYDGTLRTVAMDAILGEDELSAGANERAFIERLPAELICIMPTFDAAERFAFQTFSEQLKENLETLHAVEPGSAKALRARSSVINLLAYLTREPTPSVRTRARWPKKFHERAALWLVELQLCNSHEDAQQFLRSVGIGDTFLLRTAENGQNGSRLPTKNAEDQARHRGKNVYLTHRAKALNRSGILTRNLLHCFTKSSTTVDAMIALFPYIDLAVDVSKKDLASIVVKSLDPPQRS